MALRKLKNLCVFVRIKQLYDGFGLNYGGSGDSSLRALKSALALLKASVQIHC